MTRKRLNDIYDNEPLGFEKDPTIQNIKMLAQDPLKEIDLGDGMSKRPISTNAILGLELKVKVIQLLKEYKECFVWDYDEMAVLSRNLVELNLTIKPGKKTNKQTPRPYAPEILSKIKLEIERLFKYNFICTTRYVECSDNVPVIKKN